MPPASCRLAGSRKSGQTLTEYAIVGITIALIGVAIVLFFGKAVHGVFARLGSALKGEKADEAIVEQEPEETAQGSGGTTPSPDFDKEPIGGGGTLPQKPSAPPVPPNPLTDSATHHIGDDRAAGTTEGEGASLVNNEGPNFNLTFTLTQEMIDYASYASGGMLFLSFEAGNHVNDWNNFIDDESANGVLLNGQGIGYAANGRNVIPIAVSGLKPGEQTLTVNAGELSSVKADGTRERDDFNVWNIQIAYSGK